MENKAYMYVLECGDGTLYTGYTTDVDARLKTHQAGKGAKYTRARLPVTLIYQEEHPDKSAAMSAEALFKKKKRAEKLAYIEEKRSKSWNLLRFLISTFKIKLDAFFPWSRCCLKNLVEFVNVLKSSCT